MDPNGKAMDGDLMEKYKNWRNGYGFRTDAEVEAETCKRQHELYVLASYTDTPEQLVFTNIHTNEETVVNIADLTQAQIWAYTDQIRSGRIRIIPP